MLINRFLEFRTLRLKKGRLILRLIRDIATRNDTQFIWSALDPTILDRFFIKSEFVFHKWLWLSDLVEV